VPLVDQELFTVPEHMISSPGLFGFFFLLVCCFFGRVRVARSLVFRVVLYRSMFVLFHLAILLFVLFQFKASDYPLFFWGGGYFQTLLRV
jgi:hypothetical protein